MISKLQLAESECTKFIIPYDSFRPEKVIIVKEPSSDLLGFLVIDSTALGPGKGGLRMAADVTVDEVFRLARIMTWKCAIAGVREGLPFGRAKAGIKADPKTISQDRKSLLIRAFAEAIRPFCPQRYISAPAGLPSQFRILAFPQPHLTRRKGKPLTPQLLVKFILFGSQKTKCDRR